PEAHQLRGRTLRTTSPHLFPPLVQLPDVPVPPVVGSFCSCVSQLGQSSLLSSQGSESPRGGAGWLSFSFLQRLLRTLPPPPAGVTAATRTCRCMAWRSTGRNSHLTVNPASEHPRRRGPGAGTSAVQRWLSPVSRQGPGGCPWSRGATGNFEANFANFFLGVKRGRRSERLRRQQRGPQAGFVHRRTGPAAPEGARGSPACPSLPAPPGPGPLPLAFEWPALRGSRNLSMEGKPWPCAPVVLFLFLSAKTSTFHLR
ncbi:RIKEN cDNA D230002A01, partial [Mus musculus]